MRRLVQPDPASGDRVIGCARVSVSPYFSPPNYLLGVSFINLPVRDTPQPGREGGGALLSTAPSGPEQVTSNEFPQLLVLFSKLFFEQYFIQESEGSWISLFPGRMLAKKKAPWSQKPS